LIDRRAGVHPLPDGAPAFQQLTFRLPGSDQAFRLPGSDQAFRLPGSDQANLPKYKKLMLDVGINHALGAVF